MKFPDPPSHPAPKPLEWVTAIALVATVGVPLIFIAAVVKAFVISVLWSWYVVGHFQVEPMPLAIAFGIGLLFTYLSPIVHCEDKRSTKVKIISGLSTPVVFLALGWIGTLFI